MTEPQPNEIPAGTVEPPLLYFCCGIDCPGLSYRASEKPHPAECCGRQDGKTFPVQRSDRAK